MATGRFRSKKAAGNKTTPQQFRPLNFIIATIYLLQAALVLALHDAASSSRAVTTGFLAEDKAASGAADATVMAQASRLLFDLNLAYLVAVFLLIAGVTHLLMATRLRPVYEAGLKDKINKLRWTSFSLSLGVVMVVVAILSGLFDLSGLIMIFALSMVLGITGFMVEKRAGAKALNLLTIEGLKLGLVPLAVILIYAWGSYAYGGGVPTFLYLVYLTLLVLLVALIANLYLQVKKIGHWEDYLFSEKTYMAVSFLGFTAIAWLVFFGTFR